MTRCVWCSGAVHVDRCLACEKIQPDTGAHQMANGYRAGIPGAIPFIIGLVLWILGWVLPWIGAAGLLLMLVAGGLFAAAVWRRLGDVGRAPAVQRDE